MASRAPESMTAFNRRDALDRFRRTRARTRAMFDLLDPAAYYHKPIALRKDRSQPRRPSNESLEWRARVLRV